MLREMLGSRMFLSGWAWRSGFKDPATFCVGTARAMGGTVKSEFVREHMNMMGMSLLFPPDVSGWTGGEAWLNAATVLTRYRFALEAARQGGRWYVNNGDPRAQLESAGDTLPEAIVGHYGDLLLDGHVPGVAEDRLLDYMRRGDDNKVRTHWVLDGDRTQKKVRGMLHLMMCVAGVPTGLGDERWQGRRDVTSSRSGSAGSACSRSAGPARCSCPRWPTPGRRSGPASAATTCWWSCSSPGATTA